MISQYYLFIIIHCADFEDDLGDVVEVLSGLASRWRTIATNLRLRKDSLNAIELEHSKDVTRCLQRAIEEWLKRNYNYKRNGVPSWRMLAKAVRHLDGTIGIFKKIVNEHQGTSKCAHNIIYRI